MCGEPDINKERVQDGSPFRMLSGYELAGILPALDTVHLSTTVGPDVREFK